MQRLTTLVIALVIFVVLALYMFCFQVSFDEKAIVTTWEQADVENLIEEPGLYPKLPWPIQKVYRYPTKIQLLEQEFTQVITADNNSVVLQTYVTWRIDDPYRFFISLKNLEEARERLGTQMQNLLGEFSRYRFDQLVNTDPDQLALDEIEQTVTGDLRETIDRLDYGIHVEQVGVRRLLLPESTTEKVFERMRSTRQRLAASAEQEGQNRATAIQAEAERVKGQILSFAEAEATRIRAEGVKTGTENYSVFAENPELAIFLSKVETLKQMLPGSTLILDANALQFFDLITPAPGSAPGNDTPAPGSENAGEE
jgi:membrane protease subunit HflC